MAHIRMNQEQWSSLSEDQRSEIIKVMIDAGLMQEGDEVIPDPGATSAGTFLSSDVSTASAQDPCVKECNRLEAAAVAGCRMLDPLARETCIALARAAGDACRRACTEDR